MAAKNDDEASVCAGEACFCRAERRAWPTDVDSVTRNNVLEYVVFTNSLVKLVDNASTAPMDMLSG